MLTQLWASIKGIAASRERLDRQMNTLRQLRAELNDQATQALDTGKEDLAQQAFTQNAEIDGHLLDMAAQRHSLQADEEKATTDYEWLAAKFEAFRVEKETIEAIPTAGGVPGKIGETASGISDETGTIGTAAPDDPR
jgi:phage shock protein A